MFGCRGVCAPKRDPAADTVRVSVTFPVQGECGGHPPCEEEKKEEPPHPEEEEARQREHERREEEAEKMRQEQEAERARQEEQRQKEAEEQLRREREEAEARRQCELEETARRREEARQAEAAKQAEKERLSQEQHRKVLVAAFLRQHGYTDAKTPKRTMMRSKYPIHTAAKMGNWRMVELLIEEGANPAQKNSAGQTALQVAQQRNKRGSHADTVRELGGACP